MTLPPLALWWTCLSVLLFLSPAEPRPGRANGDGAGAAPPGALSTNAPGAFQGYTLLSPLLSRSTLLVDMQGAVVHRWDTELAPGNLAYLLPSGNLLRPGRHEDNPVFHGGGIGGRIQELGWDGEVLWDYLLSDEDRCHHHDVEPLPNGNLLVIVWERLTREDAILFGRDPAQVGPEGLWPDAVLELEPVRPSGARVVWEWHALDHLIQDLDPEKPNYGVVAEHPEKLDINVGRRAAPPDAEEQRRLREEEEQMRALGYVGGAPPPTAPAPGAHPGRPLSADWLHTNSVSWHPELDLIVLSSPRLNEIWVIDHSTTTEEAAGSSGGRWGRGGDLLWRWGNPANFGAGGAEDRRLFAQHDARWIDGPDGAPHLLVFNNGGGRPGGDFSSVDELAFPLADGRIAPSGERGFAPLKLVWTYRAEEPESFFSGFISGAQRLPNGNTLVCSGAPGKVFEVTPRRQVVWAFDNPFGGDVAPSFGKAGGPVGAGTVPPHALFRATRLAADDPGLAALAR